MKTPIFDEKDGIKEQDINLQKKLEELMERNTQLQNKLPYHIYNVDSNDEIFTGDPKFIADAQNYLLFVHHFVYSSLFC